jgi:hypothetical protein
MNTYFLIAAGIAVFVGIAHSVIGELMIFQKLRKSGLVPNEAAPPLQARNVRILWATWHLASVFGFAMAAILFCLGKTSDTDLYALANREAATNAYIVNVLIFAFAGGAALVLIATRGKHPGWIGLLAAAVFAHLGQSI